MMENYIKEFGHMFYTRDKWTEFLNKENIQFSIGSRFHGNMMAFSNGIPAMWIVHDFIAIYSISGFEQILNG